MSPHPLLDPSNSRALFSILGAIAGIAIHLSLFIRGEWHLQAPTVLKSHAALFALSMFVKNGVFFASAYCISLFTSITTYRLFFHPLTRAGFAGPTSMRMSKLVHSWKCLFTSNHLVLHDLHKRYGDFVRTGPSEITIYHPDAFLVLDGAKSTCIKSEFYDVLHPNRSLIATRAKDKHAARRREWNRGFNKTATDSYLAKSQTHISSLLSLIRASAQSHTEADIRDLMYWYGFDVMGDFIFNQSFGMLENQRWHETVRLLRKGFEVLGPTAPVPWAIQIAFNCLPSVGPLREWKEMNEWCVRTMEGRVEASEKCETSIPDVAYFLIEKARENGFSEEDWQWLCGDSLLAMIAGSEPTADALLGAFYFLSKNPSHIEKIHEELKNVDVTSVEELAGLRHLNAVMQESLRLFHPVPTGGIRKAQAEGVVIGDTYIPPYTTLVAPRYSIFRREDVFENAEEFIPERWYSKPVTFSSQTGYAPFGTGATSCLGRAFGLDQMRLVLAQVIQKYRFEIAPGEGKDRFMVDLMDHFTSNPGQLKLVFSARK
ncbi:unnamed protein product [Periconia digitata]|uniref:Cytochrome P450 n=1 Tax=Periconia digitata TaxID=1303443 RepID=A0A9W4XM51_9PLEO|nr:unnamed protein product [Periconia digitata]